MSKTIARAGIIPVYDPVQHGEPARHDAYTSDGQQLSLCAPQAVRAGPQLVPAMAAAAASAPAAAPSGPAAGAGGAPEAGQAECALALSSAWLDC